MILTTEQHSKHPFTDQNTQHIRLLGVTHILTKLSDPAERRIFCADGCHRTRPTRRWCLRRSTIGSVMFLCRPPSGICQTLTRQSSEAEAMTLSLWGHHAMSRTGPLWPPTRGTSGLTRPTFSRGRMRNAPPPPDSTMTAKNFGLTAQNVESHDDLETLMLS